MAAREAADGHKLAAAHELGVQVVEDAEQGQQHGAHNGPLQRVVKRVHAPNDAQARQVRVGTCKISPDQIFLMQKSNPTSQDPVRQLLLTSATLS